MRRRRTMAILGGGPVGLSALVRALDSGWEARLYERGRIGENVRGWGHVRMFSPVGMNRVAPAAGAPAAGHAGPNPPDTHATDALLTGAEYVERHLEPLVGDPDLRPWVHTGTEVIAVSRDGLRKTEEIATPGRGAGPFRLLLEDADGERSETAHVVLDATGTFATPNWLGEGGMPAVGERSAREAIDYRLPDPGPARRDFTGRRTLVVGAGHSAATAILWLGDLAREAPGTQVIWATRSAAARPIPEVARDPLPERARVARSANDEAERGGPWLLRLAGAALRQVRRRPEGLAVVISQSGSERRLEVDRLLALVGYRPDLALGRELQVQTCWATEGTYGLAAALLAGGSAAAADCLRSPTPGSSTLVHPEPGFFTLGAKSYGRNPNFLIRTGVQQVESVLALLAAGET